MLSVAHIRYQLGYMLGIRVSLSFFHEYARHGNTAGRAKISRGLIGFI